MAPGDQPTAGTATSCSGAFRRHLYIAPAFAISLFVCGWFATWGDWKLFEPESLGAYYDAQALSLINGRLDVPAEAIGFEAFEFNGKTYGYFGIGPTLLRLPLVLLFSNLDGLWSRTMVLLACAINLVCAYGILRLLRGGCPEAPSIGERLLDSLFIICAAIGSTNVFLVARGFVFHEASMWGGAFALLFALTLLRYFQTPTPARLACAGAFAFFSFHSRATVGAGTLLALCVVVVILLRRRFLRADAGETALGFGLTPKPLAHLVVALVAIVFAVGSYFAINYAKFQTISGLPLQYYRQYNVAQARMEVTGAKQLHFENIATGLTTYFGWRGVRLEPLFPWFNLVREPMMIGTPSIDVVEAFSTVPVSMPALTMLAVIGGCILLRGSDSRIRSARLPTVAFALGGAVVLTTVGITERYLHDFYPALILCAAVGLSDLGSRRPFAGKIAIGVALVLISVALNCSFALVNQRTAPWGVPAAKRAEFARWQQMFRD